MKKSETSTRRQFCLRAISVAALAPILDACAGGGGNPAAPGGGGSIPQLSVINASVAGNNTIAITIDASSPLNAVPSAALVNYGSGALLVARTGQSTFNAMGATCTHQACTITGYANNEFVCPCHGSTFSTSGQVLGGPAPQSLPTVAANFSGNTLTLG